MKIKFNYYNSTPGRLSRAWSFNILPIIQISNFKHESIELIIGWLFWEFEIRLLLKEKE